MAVCISHCIVVGLSNHSKNVLAIFFQQIFNGQDSTLVNQHRQLCLIAHLNYIRDIARGQHGLQIGGIAIQRSCNEIDLRVGARLQFHHGQLFRIPSVRRDGHIRKFQRSFFCQRSHRR